MNLTPKQINRRGETIIELMIYISMAILLLGAIVSVQTLVIRSRQRFAAANAVGEQAAIIMSTIGNKIRNSTALSTPTTGQTTSSLILTTDAPATSPSTFSLSGTTLRLTEGASTPVSLNPTNIIASALSFQNLSGPTTPGIVRVTFTLSATYGNGLNYSHTYQNSYGRR